MVDFEKRPGFVEAWLADLQDDVRRYGKRKLIPVTLIAFCCIGVLVAIFVTRENFWNKSELVVAFFASILTINGLFLALSWTSFAKIYEIAARPKLASFLRRKGMLNSYIFYVDFIHYTQLCALCWSAVALVLSIIGRLPQALEQYVSLLVLQKIVLAGCIASSLYALKYALGAVTILQDLVWNSAHLPEDNAEVEMTVHDGGRGTL